MQVVQIHFERTKRIKHGIWTVCQYQMRDHHIALKPNVKCKFVLFLINSMEIVYQLYLSINFWIVILVFFSSISFFPNSTAPCFPILCQYATRCCNCMHTSWYTKWGLWNLYQWWLQWVDTSDGSTRSAIYSHADRHLTNSFESIIIVLSLRKIKIKMDTVCVLQHKHNLEFYMIKWRNRLI